MEKKEVIIDKDLDIRLIQLDQEGDLYIHIYILNAYLEMRGQISHER